MNEREYEGDVIDLMHPTRRELLLGSGALFAWAYRAATGARPRAAIRASCRSCCAARSMGSPPSRRSAIPTGTACAATRRSRSTARRRHCRSIRLFALNPAMPNLHRLYQAGQATIVHAAATPYRERSHFDGQDVLESGARAAGRDRKPAGSTARWSALAPGGRSRSARPAGLRGRSGHAAGGARPGAGAVLGAAAAAAGQRRHDDARCSISIATPIRRSRACSRSASGSPPSRKAGGMSREPANARRAGGGVAQVRAYFAEAAGAAAKFLAAAGWPARRRARLRRLGHPRQRGRGQGPAGRRCSARSTAPSRAIETNMGDAWRETVVALVTEFGRTARINGTDGTDHGTATVAFLAGGALKGGRVIADWPGLKDSRPLREPRPQADDRSARACSRACCTITCASTTRRWRGRFSPTAPR